MTVHESAAVGFALLDPSSRVIYINDVLASYVNQRPAQLLGQRLAVHWPHLAGHLQELVQRREYPNASAQMDKTIEFRSVAGGFRRALCSYHAALQADGSEVIGLVVVDIVEPSSAEVALQESEERYRTLVDSAPDAIMVLKNDRILFANPAAAAMAGVSRPSDLVGMLAFDWVTSPHRERLEADIANMDSQSVLAGRLVEFTLPDGRVRSAEAHATIASFRGETVVQVIARDITARVGAETALRASEDRYRLLIDTSPDGIVVLEDEIIVYANAVYARYIGYDAATQLIGKPILDAVPEFVRPKAREAIDQALLTRKPYFQEIGFGSAGEERWFESTTTLLKVSAHRVMQVMIREVTEQKRLLQSTASLNELLEARVTERTAQLEAVIQELEAFSYSVSHDLRAPLRHISAHASLLMERHEVVASEDAAQHARGIVTAAARLAQLVDDLLEFSRMGRAQMGEVPVNMYELANFAREELETDLLGRQVIWSMMELPACRGDPAMLQLVWRNLLGNAVKYTRTRAEAHITLGATTSATEVTYSVRDNGVGFDMRYADKLFGVFERLHSQRQFEGTGIGLANVRRIVQRHGGRVWAEGQPDVGAIFYFSLPLSIEP